MTIVRDVEDSEEVEYGYSVPGPSDGEGWPVTRVVMRSFATAAEADAFADRFDDALRGRMTPDALSDLRAEAFPEGGVPAGEGPRRFGVRTFRTSRSRDASRREALPTPVAWMAVRDADGRMPWTNTQPSREMAEHALRPHEGTVVPLFAGLPPAPGYLEGLIRMRAVVAGALAAGDAADPAATQAVLAACDAEVAAAEAVAPDWGMSLPEVVMCGDEGADGALRHAAAGLAVWPATPGAVPDADARAAEDLRARAGELRELCREFEGRVGSVLDRIG